MSAGNNGRSLAEGPGPRPALQIGDYYRTPSGKIGPLLQLGTRNDWGDGSACWRAFVLISCDLGRGEHIKIRAAYHPGDLIPANLDPASTEAAIQRLRGLR